MSNKKWSRVNNRRKNGTFSQLPHALLDSPAFISLSSKAVKCLIDIFRPYNGINNGDLSCTIKVMKQRGWKSKNHLERAKQELLENGIIVLTRQGGRNKCNLYAVTWIQIHECNGKLDRKPTNKPLGYWQSGYNPELSNRSNKLISPPQIEATPSPNRGAVWDNYLIIFIHCPK